MPLYTADALILRTYTLAEADRIVVFLTRDRGKKRGVAKGARRPRSRFMGALEPLTEVRVAYFEKERRELVSLNYAEPARSPLTAAREDALAHVGYFAELIDEWAQEADPNETLFRLGVSVVESLAAGVPVEPLARYFEYWLLRLQGVYPPHFACHRCGGSLDADADGGAYLAPGAHVFTCQRCAAEPAGPPRGPSLSTGALGFLRHARTIAPARLAEIRLPAPVARELEQVHRSLIATHLEKDLKSARVLREMKKGQASTKA